jgi:hypothetical protein
MKFSTVAAFAMTLGLFVTGSTIAFSQTAAPIQVQSLQYQPYNTDTSDSGITPVRQPGIMITFKNVSSKPIHAVIFSIKDASGFELGAVSRHGTFSPGVSITRYFGDVKLKDKHGLPAKATPIDVGFKDGTEWPPK